MVHRAFRFPLSALSYSSKRGTEMKLFARAFVLLVVMLAVVAGGASGAPILRDGFEPSIDHTLWLKGPSDWAGVQGHEELKGDDSHLRTPGTNAAREWVNFRVSYNSQRVLSAAYDGGVYLKCWIFEDNDISFPGYYSEFLPNGYMTLLDTTTVNDFFRVGVMGEYGRGKTTRVWFENCAVETSTDGPKPLDGAMGRPLVPRRQGWRKFTVLLHPYTGMAGDAQFFIDDKLVFNGKRASSPFGGGAPVDKIILGSKWWSNETYWYDHIDFGFVETPVSCGSIAEARALPDCTWVELTQKVVVGRFTKSPFSGCFAIGESDPSNRGGVAGLWVSSSYEAAIAAATHEGEKVNITGIMYTNEAGGRYLDAIQVTRAQNLASQPPIAGTNLRGLRSSRLDGVLAKVWGKVVDVPGSNPATVKGQERRGDWRRYFLIDDGSPNAPVKCYYDNIISGTDPVPVVRNGDYVSVVGVVGTEVLVPGTTGPETSIWIRKAGDLAILRAAP